MNAFKQLAVFGVLAAAGVGLYFKMQGPPDPLPPADFSGDWGTPPAVELPSGTDVPESNPVESGPPSFAGSAAPAFDGPTPGVNGRLPDTASAGDGPADAALPPEPAAQAPDAAAPATAAPSAGAAQGLYGRSPPAASQVPDEAGGAAQMAGADTVTYQAARQAADTALDRDQLAEALLILSPWHSNASLSISDQRDLGSLLSQLAGTVIYSREHYLQPAYIVQTGDTLESVARKYDVPWQLLAKINGLSAPDQVQPGEELKVLRGPFSAVVRLEARELTLIVGGYYAGRFVIGVGTERPKMEGEWIVKHKETNPAYYGRDRVIDRDDASNPLGEYWIGLASAEDQQVVEPFGIHGTNDSQTLYENDPRGYIRMLPSDVADLYDIVSIGSKVVIRR